jgi:hypothetical protein
MNRMIRLFQQKSNKRFEEYLLAKRKTPSETSGEEYPTIQDVLCATLKVESDTWAKAAELLRREETAK